MMNTKNTTTWGYANAIISAATFGSIPLFSIPVMSAGMPLPSVLVYRFVVGCGLMLMFLLWKRIGLKLCVREVVELFVIALMYAVSAVCLFKSYDYMPSGIATTLIFSYPIWTAIIMTTFFRERLTRRTCLAIVLAFAGVFLLCGFGESSNIKSYLGVALGLFSGFTYAIYVVGFPHLKVKSLPSLKVTFYIFLFASIQLLIYSFVADGRLAAIDSVASGLSLVLLGLIPTTVSNVTLVKSLTQIDSTSVATLGAFEPLTAMLIGILVFDEPLTFAIMVGFVLIVASVLTLIFGSSRAKSSA